MKTAIFISILALCSIAQATTDEQLWQAICQVESGGRVGAVGDGGRALGVAQIWDVVVYDCNRILGRTEFSLADRLSPERSKQMFFIYTRFYCGNNYTPERAARIWNGGPCGFKKQSTIKYWLKVKSILEKSNV